MAKLISEVKQSRKITIEFTEEELGTLVAAFGLTSHMDTSDQAEGEGYPYLEDSEDEYELYELLERILMNREAVVSQRQ